MKNLRDSIETLGKTVDIAVNDALKQLDITRDAVEIVVLDEGRVGFLGLWSQPARVKVSRKHNPEQIARDFLGEVILAMGLNASLNITSSDKQMSIKIEGDDIGVLIGKRGHTLDSLQYLLSLVVNKGKSPYINILVDAQNYRQKRRETLENLAQNLVKKAKTTRNKVVLEPMTSFERRIIHATLQSEPGVETHSEGKEPYRYIVITPVPNSR